MLQKIWTKYTILEENKSSSTIKTYLARIEHVVKIIIIKNENEYYLIKEKIEILKNEKGIYEIIGEKNKIYIVMDSNQETIHKVDELIEGILTSQKNPFEATPTEIKNSSLQGDIAGQKISKDFNVQNSLFQKEYYSSAPKEISNIQTESTVQNSVITDNAFVGDTAFLPNNPEEAKNPVINQTIQGMTTSSDKIPNNPYSNAEQIPVYSIQQVSNDDLYSNNQYFSDNPSIFGVTSAYPINNTEQISNKPAYNELNEQITVMAPSSAGGMTLVDNQNFGTIAYSTPPVVTNPTPLLVNSTIWNNGSILPTTSNITSSNIMTQSRLSFNQLNNSGLSNFILDEDFKRKRPVYDENNRYNEELYLYRTFVFGKNFQ